MSQLRPLYEVGAILPLTFSSGEYSVNNEQKVSKRDSHVILKNY